VIVNFTNLAEFDLEEIGDRISRDDPISAATFVYELRERCRGLATYPNRFPSVRQYDQYALRKLSVHGYLIFYAVKAKSIDIMRVVHGSADWMTLFDIPLE
jgi:toxin ParE1/3/4